MSTLTPRLNLTLPASGDVVSRTTGFNGNWSFLDSQVGVTECTSLTRPASPYFGMVIFETDTLQLAFRNAANTLWRYIRSVPVVSATSDITVPTNGQLCFDLTTFSLMVYRSAVTAWARYPDTDNVLNDVQNVAGTTTSTSYVAAIGAGVVCGKAFVAPPSGKVAITNNLWITGAGTGFCTIRVCLGAVVGSGAVFGSFSASDNNACIMTSAASFGQSRRTLVTGLTPFNSYNVQQWFKVISGTGTFEKKELIIEPK